MAYQYGAAISFLSQDEGLARTFAEGIERALQQPVFLYSERQRDLTGKTFEEALCPVFESQSRLVVVLYRPGWGRQGGTLVEYRSINRRRLRGDERFLLPVVLEGGSTPPPWSDDVLHYNLHTYGFADAINAIARMYVDHEQASLPADSPPEPAVSRRSILALAMRNTLHATFITTPGPFRGYFGAAETASESKRWQSRGGESTADVVIPKRPYYHTYWGYEAALRLDPASVAIWAPLTLDAISQHFNGDRWLKVVREYAFCDGPVKKPALAESVRHTARAAELTHFLKPEHRRVSEVAWDLVHGAALLQHPDGGWQEFREEGNPPGLWATVYVYRFLSKLASARDPAVPDERQAFLERASPLLSRSEQFLAQHWQQHKWQLEGAVPWDEGAAAVLAEIGPFACDENLVLGAYYALRSTLTPAGRLSTVQDAPGRPSETALALRVAFGLKSCGRGLAEEDSRYRRLVAWLAETLILSQLSVYDIAFAAAVLDHRPALSSNAESDAAEQGDADDGDSRRS